MSQAEQEKNLRQALHLIKFHISETPNTHNRDLHNAVQLIVNVARVHGMLTN